jgi:plasmid stabilization system protein ParE
MRVDFHPDVFSDLSKVMEYYEREATKELADDFFREFQFYVELAAQRPETFPVRARGIRRVNFSRFPYHFLFRMIENSVRVLVVRHHRRHPSLGQKRR